MPAVRQLRLHSFSAAGAVVAALGSRPLTAAPLRALHLDYIPDPTWASVVAPLLGHHGQTLRELSLGGVPADCRPGDTRVGYAVAAAGGGMPALPHPQPHYRPLWRRRRRGGGRRVPGADHPRRLWRGRPRRGPRRRRARAAPPDAPVVDNDGRRAAARRSDAAPRRPRARRGDARPPRPPRRARPRGGPGGGGAQRGGRAAGGAGPGHRGAVYRRHPPPRRRRVARRGAGGAAAAGARRGRHRRRARRARPPPRARLPLRPRCRRARGAPLPRVAVAATWASRRGRACGRGRCCRRCWRRSPRRGPR